MIIRHNIHREVSEIEARQPRILRIRHRAIIIVAGALPKLRAPPVANVAVDEPPHVHELVQHRDCLVGDIWIRCAGDLALERDWAVEERWADDEVECVGGGLAESGRLGPVLADLGFAARVAAETDAGVIAAGIPV